MVSISLRLRRIVWEEAYVNVPVDEVLVEDGNGGTKIDFDLFVQKAIEYSQNPGTQWVFEGIEQIEAHPIQKPRPDLNL